MNGRVYTLRVHSVHSWKLKPLHMAAFSLCPNVKSYNMRVCGASFFMVSRQSVVDPCRTALQAITEGICVLNWEVACHILLVHIIALI